MIGNIAFDKWHTEIEPWSHSLLWKTLNSLPVPVEQLQWVSVLTLYQTSKVKERNINLCVQSKRRQVCTWSSSWLKTRHVENYWSSDEKIILFIALMYRKPSGSVIFSLVRGGMTPLVKYLNAGLGDWMASRNTLETKTNTPQQWDAEVLLLWHFVL